MIFWQAACRTSERPKPLTLRNPDLIATTKNLWSSQAIHQLTDWVAARGNYRDFSAPKNGASE